MISENFHIVKAGIRIMKMLPAKKMQGPDMVFFIERTR